MPGETLIAPGVQEEPALERDLRADLDTPGGPEAADLAERRAGDCQTGEAARVHPVNGVERLTAHLELESPFVRQVEVLHDRGIHIEEARAPGNERALIAGANHAVGHGLEAGGIEP